VKTRDLLNLSPFLKDNFSQIEASTEAAAVVTEGGMRIAASPYVANAVGPSTARESGMNDTGPTAGPWRDNGRENTLADVEMEVQLLRLEWMWLDLSP
jgi:hypothetical protein